MIKAFNWNRKKCKPEWNIVVIKKTMNVMNKD
jgi:hypothetical protein